MHENVWSALTWARIKADAPAVALVTDVRFPNEAESLRARGGILCRVLRPALPVSLDLHPSEALIPTLTVDATLVNEGLDYLPGAVEWLWRRTRRLLWDRGHVNPWLSPDDEYPPEGGKAGPVEG